MNLNYLDMKDELKFSAGTVALGGLGAFIPDSRMYKDSDSEDLKRAMMAYHFFYPSVYCLDSWDINTGFELTPLSWENNIGFWEELARMINTEPTYEPYCAMYNELAALGIEKGKPFAPDIRMKGILEKAAKTANAHMRVQYFAKREPGPLMWDGRRWEIASMSDDSTPAAPNYTDRYIREKWLNSALWETSSLGRMGGAGFLHCLATCDSAGSLLHSSNNYKLSIPCPIPAQLFWTIALYDVLTGNEIMAEETNATLRPLQEQRGRAGSSIELYFGSAPMAGKEKAWIKTPPDEGWFAYFRIYGPGRSAFDGRWKPGDFEVLK